MKILTSQQKIINKAIKLLTPFNKEDVSYSLYYFAKSENGDEFSEYDCCDNLKCVEKTVKELKKAFPLLETIYSHNDGDHERIDSCYQCGRPLNSQLTWIKYEFEHHKVHSIKKRDLKKSRTAFDVICMFSAMPSSDESISEYAKHQNRMGNSKPLNDQIKRQEEFIKEVIDYANHIIKILQ